MPTPQPKPIQPAAEPKPPEAKSKSQFESLSQITEFLNGLAHHELEGLLTFRMILERDRGCTTPVEEFICRLVDVYRSGEEDGRGLTLDTIEHCLEEMRDNYTDAIELAHFVASRYDIPKDPEESTSTAANQR